jgi:uncharacterized membrane protein YtjA (UPF0391 family)
MMRWNLPIVSVNDLRSVKSNCTTAASECCQTAYSGRVFCSGSYARASGLGLRSGCSTGVPLAPLANAAMLRTRQQPDLCLKLRCMLLDWKMNRDCQMGAAFLISIVAGVLGFTGISAASANTAGILFYIFAVIFLVLLILGARGISGLTTANVARSRSGQMRAQVINRSRRKQCRANL